MTKNFTYKNKLILWGHIFIQLGFYVKNLFLIKEGYFRPAWTFLTLIFALANLVSFLVLLEEGSKAYFLHGALGLIAINGYFLLESLLEVHFQQTLFLRYFVLFQLVLTFMDILMEGNYNFFRIRLLSVFYFAGIIYSNYRMSISTSIAYLGTYLVFSLFPLVFFICKRKKLRKHGLYSYKLVFLISITMMMYFFASFYLSSFWGALDNLDEFYMMIPFIIVILFLLIKARSMKVVFLIVHFKKCILCLFLTFIGLLVINGIPDSLLDFICLTAHLSLIIFLVFTYLNYQNLANQDLEDLFKKGKVNLYLEKYARLYAQRSARFLHDNVLQDMIVVQKLLQRTREFTGKEEILHLITINIQKIRLEMNAYAPSLNPKVGLGDNYYQLIKDLKEKYQNQEILVDFTCSKDLELPRPYDRFVYQVLYELITNLYKHSKGNYAEIYIARQGNCLNLSMINFGDYLDTDANLLKESLGLRFLNLEAQRLGGEFSQREIKIEGESRLKFSLECPIKKEVIYEDYVNRRS